VTYARDYFNVGQPSLLKDKYVVYLTRGVDRNNYKWEANRRYNEFFALKEAFSRSWPGIYIPYMPSKKIIGNRDVKFIIERRYFLERFYMQMSRYDYLIYGPEWALFCHPREGPKEGDLATQLKTLQPPSYLQMLHNFMVVFNIDADFLKTLHFQAKRVEADQLISNFEEFLRKLKVHFKNLKKQVKMLIETQQTKIDLEKQVIFILNKFEERTNQFIDQPNKNNKEVHLQSNILTADIVRQAS
jgi:sorting nexin-1/2